MINCRPENYFDVTPEKDWGCTAFECDSEHSECRIFYTEVACDDGDACTIKDQCLNGVCQGKALSCNDANSCTDDVCVDGQCVFSPNFSPCSDHNPCTEGDVCGDLGQCIPGTVKSCSTDNTCLDAFCDDATGQCVTRPASRSCNDNNSCTSNDFCEDGECKGVDTSSNCADDNVCTSEHCDPAIGCVTEFNDAHCDDGLVCTVDDTCHDGSCDGVPKECNNNDKPCLVNVRCEEPAGCVGDEYNCRSPCIAGSCDGEGGCNIDVISVDFLPKVYFSFARVNDNEQDNFVLRLDAKSLTLDKYYPRRTLFVTLDIDRDSGLLYGASNANQFIEIGKDDGSLRVIGNTGLDPHNIQIVDLAFRQSPFTRNPPHRRELWALTTQGLYKIDILTGQATAVEGFTLDRRVYAIAFDFTGLNLWGITEDKQLRKWNIQSGVGQDFCLPGEGQTLLPEGRVVSLQSRYDGSLVVAVVKTAEDGTATSSLVSLLVDGERCDQTIVTLHENALDFEPRQDQVDPVYIWDIVVDETYCPATIPNGPPNPTPSVSPTPFASPSPLPSLLPIYSKTPNPADQSSSSSSDGAGGLYPGKATNDRIITNNPITTVTSAAVGAGAVGILGLFGLVMAVYQTKEKKAVPLEALLDEEQMQTIASENPLFQGVEVTHNVLAANANAI